MLQERPGKNCTQNEYRRTELNLSEMKAGARAFISLHFCRYVRIFTVARLS